MTSFFVSVTHLKGTHYNVHPAPSSVCLSICLVFCSVTQPIPRGIILSREQLCSRWAKHVGCTRSNTQHRAGFSGAYALWVQVQQISGWELDKPASLALFPPNTTIPPPRQQTHTVQSIHSPVEQMSWTVCSYNHFIFPWQEKVMENQSKQSFSLQLLLYVFLCQCHLIGYSCINKSISIKSCFRKRRFLHK